MSNQSNDHADCKKSKIDISPGDGGFGAVKDDITAQTDILVWGDRGGADNRAGKVQVDVSSGVEERPLVDKLQARVAFACVHRKTRQKRHFGPSEEFILHRGLQGDQIVRVPLLHHGQAVVTVRVLALHRSETAWCVADILLNDAARLHSIGQHGVQVHFAEAWRREDKFDG